jgi:outer membrane protein TolC
MWSYRYTGLVFFLFLISPGIQAQTRIITIEKCYELAKQNYPLIRSHDLIARTSNYSIENAGKSFLPQFSVSGFASYQSQTINFQDVVGGGPGVLIPPLSKDQYKIQAEVNQTIYDGGQVKNQQDLIRVNEASQQQNLEVNLYALKDRINQLYFSILLMEEQKKQNDIKRDNFRNAADKALAAFQNGTALKSNVDELEAEIANTEMTDIGLEANRKAYSDMLSIFIGQPIDEHSVMIMPPVLLPDSVIRRPELNLFDLEKNKYDVQERQLRSEYLPKLNAFVQAAYGRPTLNFVSNNFGGWWVGGIRLFWNLGSLYTLKNNKENLKINKEYLEINKETFIYNTSLSMTQQNGELMKYAALLQKDDAVISLRTAVAKAAKAQLENGVVTVHDYISKVNEEDQARQTKILHSVQLVQAQYQYKNTTGN